MEEGGWYTNGAGSKGCGGKGNERQHGLGRLVAGCNTRTRNAIIMQTRPNTRLDRETGWSEAGVEKGCLGGGVAGWWGYICVYMQGENRNERRRISRDVTMPEKTGMPVLRELRKDEFTWRRTISLRTPHYSIACAIGCRLVYQLYPLNCLTRNEFSRARHRPTLVVLLQFQGGKNIKSCFMGYERNW